MADVHEILIATRVEETAYGNRKTIHWFKFSKILRQVKYLGVYNAEMFSHFDSKLSMPQLFSYN